MAERWPSDFVIRELRGRYLSRVKHLAKIARRHAEMGAKSRFPGLFLGGYLLVRLYLRVGEIQAARDALNSLPQRYPQDDVLSGLLDQVLGKGAKIEKYIQLSSFFWRNEEEVGLVICRAAVARFPGAGGVGI